jgi:phenylalanyl-tRNA synthetase beta chain
VALPSRFPAVAVDLTLTHATGVAWSEIEAAIALLAPADLASFGLKDRYQGRGVPEGAVNTTVAFLYNAGDRSLTQEEVNDRHGAVARELARRFGWQGPGGVPG